MSSTRADAHDRYSAAARIVLNGYRQMAAAAETILAEDLADLLDGEEARASGITGITEVTIRIEWSGSESTDETVTAVRNSHGADVANAVLAQQDGATIAEWLTEQILDLPGRTYLVDALREADELPTDIVITVPQNATA
ncbi:hypothetical protein DVS28_b0089 (plasmid) [Euzebya pacifica]|uniref:Uncharacterized protein n=1 Tax=Euzebya pacifica TaxID=1608957 RepID=A0A346Y5W2_9ACTN|nr:hypothetical protein [Euzebya pacifica]AXV09859.1 hypothetical protein DVS28_b0089 [Euzebya pacifica]